MYDYLWVMPLFPLNNLAFICNVAFNVLLQLLQNAYCLTV